MAAITFNLQQEVDQVRFEEINSLGARVVTLNRPTKLNPVNYEMVSKILTTVERYEYDPEVSCIILKANGKAFSAGGDVISVICSSLAGHWSYPMQFYRKMLMASYLVATFKKPVVSLIHGLVMGGGAGLSMQTMFRVVTEKTVFAMPEASIGLFPDVGASYYLSRLPGFFGEYLALTGARVDGPEMVACGLASHFVPSKSIHLLEKAICEQVLSSSTASNILAIIQRFSQTPKLKQDSVFKRLETIINKCFSRNTVEEILSSLENEVTIGAEKWIKDAYRSMKSASPTSLKVTLKSIREGRRQNLEQCLFREFFIFGHMVRGTINRDFYEGSRALLFDKDKKPKWNPPSLELVTEEIVNKFFEDIDDPDLGPLLLPRRSHDLITAKL
ncbi:3-hydroxyisobutyryl-CoA hydrolase 1-like [Punica granatum]|uniref:3-hydroxyisobutyryl-CoA hydrolase n=1 Tax=Punica granatum TaxID=22663 RepID=A0A6P8CAU6_PUNGR|nr:3-hydroxyisobutyryl-CoA hydrolase 1-like [Punica granatum]